MMELLIVRHAIACEGDAKRWPDDGARPLSPRGVLRARRAAAGLKKLAVRPVRVLVSPLVRTQQTAAILTQYAGWPRAHYTPRREGASTVIRPAFGVALVGDSVADDEQLHHRRPQWISASASALQARAAARQRWLRWE